MRRTRLIGISITALLLIAAAALAAWFFLRDRFSGEDVSMSADGGDHQHRTTASVETPTTSEEPRIPIDVPIEQQARIGVKVTTAAREPVETTIRSVGFVAPNERLEVHVHTRIAGYVEDLVVDAVGDRVKRGQVLYRLYSPDVYATEYEYAAAAKGGQLSAMLARTALERLELWDVPRAEIARLRKTKKPRRTIPFTSPVEGFVIDKPVLQGMYVQPEMKLFHIADLSVVWVMVTLYEHELPVVEVGDPAVVSVAGLPGRALEGTLSYIYPDIDLATRTARARIEVDNPGFALKPGMYAQVNLSKHLGEALVVPDDAVIDTGVRHIVFVRHDGTHFVPREVEVGPEVADKRIIRSGLDPGEEVVVRANFLIDAESRLQAALRRGDAPAGHGGHAGQTAG